jgi:hypothetical protein
MASEKTNLEDALLTNEWEIDCVAMTLTQEGSDAPESVKGKGFLRQGDDGLVHFRLYPTHPVVRRPFQEIEGWTPGKIIEASRYYTLTADDVPGRTWIAHRVLPEFSAFYSDGAWDSIVSGTLRDVERKRQSHYKRRKTHIRVVFFADVSLPANTVTEVVRKVGGNDDGGSISLDVATVETPLGTFVIRTEPGKLIASFASDRPDIEEHFFVRIMEALSFIFGKRLGWNYVEEHRHGVEIERVRGEKMSDTSALPTPVDERVTPNPFFIWRVFSLYLSFVSSHHGGTLHHCSGLLFPVYQARQGTIEAQALALGVAVEGLCKELFPETSEQARQLREWVKSLRKHCEQWDGFQDQGIRKALFDRVGGLLGQLNNIRAKDTLMRLAAEGALQERHVKAWGTLRNQAAHASIQAGGPLQELVDLCEAVTVLMYHLVFKAIGYEGAFSDWSEYGYPVRWFRGRRPTEEEIAVAAYFLYLKEPDRHGNDLQHWFAARAALGKGWY